MLLYLHPLQIQYNWIQHYRVYVLILIFSKMSDQKWTVQQQCTKLWVVNQTGLYFFLFLQEPFHPCFNVYS